jgi:hypothetical protein
MLNYRKNSALCCDRESPSRALSGAGALSQAAEAYEKAEACDLGATLVWYQHRIEALAGSGNPAEHWYQERLRRCEERRASRASIDVE